MEFVRTIFWNKDHGAVIPMDRLLGIESSNHSHGVCEICCRESLNTAFVGASDNIKRLAQLDISSSTVRQIVEQEGRNLVDAQRKGQAGPGFTSKDCTDGTVIVGSDGVMVPMVTEEQKHKRRQTESKKRTEENRKSTARAARPRKGSDGDYKEFKIVTFYDEDKSHQYVVGTNGNHEVAGRAMRRIGRQLDLSEARRKYSVTDGAPWILNQLNVQLPMLDDNVLDFYHLREHVTETSHALFGEGSQDALSWKEKMMEAAKNQGSRPPAVLSGEVQLSVQSAYISQPRATLPPTLGAGCHYRAYYRNRHHAWLQMVSLPANRGEEELTVHPPKRNRN